MVQGFDESPAATASSTTSASTGLAVNSIRFESRRDIIHNKFEFNLDKFKAALSKRGPVLAENEGGS